MKQHKTPSFVAEFPLKTTPVNIKHVLGKQVVGLDIGPSVIAGVSATDAILEKFCLSVAKPWKAIHRIQRVMDRSRRAINPQNYDARGVPLKVKHKLASLCAELERRLASERQHAHGELCNRILKTGEYY